MCFYSILMWLSYLVVCPSSQGHFDIWVQMKTFVFLETISSLKWISFCSQWEWSQTKFWKIKFSSQPHNYNKEKWYTTCVSCAIDHTQQIWCIVKWTAVKNETRRQRSLDIAWILTHTRFNHTRIWRRFSHTKGLLQDPR